MPLELRHLKHFLALSEELHFGRAANRLHIVQPALSKSIMTLERELGVELFVRTKRSVAITEAGSVLAQEARLILARVDRAVDATRLADTGHIGRLEVGYIAPATWSVLPPVLREHRIHYPGVKLRLTELPSAEQLVALEQDSLDVGFVRMPLHHEDLTFEVVHREPFVATLPESHPLAREPVVAVEALAEEPFIAATRAAEPGFYDQCIAVFAEHGLVPKIVEEANAPSAMLGMVAIGLGVTVSPLSLLTMPRVGVICRPLRDSSVVLELAVARRSNTHSAVLDAFLDAVNKAAAAYARTPERRPAKRRGNTHSSAA